MTVCVGLFLVFVGLIFVLLFLNAVKMLESILDLRNNR